MPRRASVVLLSILCGCAEPSRQSDQRLASTADSISNPATTHALEVEEEFRIGEVEGAWEKQFQHIRGVALDRNGLIYVANGMPNEIRVFKTDGSFVRRFGKPGGGPGEFRRITAMRLMRDTLLIEDTGSGRFTTYTTDGRYVRSFVQYIKPHFVQTLGFYDGAYIAQRWPPTKRERREGQVYQDSAQVVALDSAGRKIVRDIVKYPNRRAVGTKWAARGGESG
ncbi:MAG TPA: 6-bladed beta-propeller, partial [Longimicrobiales bacterium]